MRGALEGDVSFHLLSFRLLRTSTNLCHFAYSTYNYITSIHMVYLVTFYDLTYELVCQ